MRHHPDPAIVPVAIYNTMPTAELQYITDSVVDLLTSHEETGASDAQLLVALLHVVGAWIAHMSLMPDWQQPLGEALPYIRAGYDDYRLEEVH